MSTQTYIVEKGDTLSGLAKRFSSTVRQLRELNPFINNPNYIRTGWRLTVPNNPVPAPDNIAPDDEMTAALPVIHFDAIDEDPPHDEINFCSNKACGCDDHFTDILYEVGHECFWLLREHTLDSIVKAADQLHRAVLTADPDSRLKALDERGLMDYFLEPKLSSFLDAEDSQRYHVLEYEMKTLKAEIDQLQALETNTVARDFGSVTNLSAAERQAVYKKREAHRSLHPEWLALENKARQQAAKEGYRFEGGELFSPEAIEMRSIIKTYLEQRQLLIEHKIPDFRAEEIGEFRRVQAQLQEELSDAVLGPGGSLAGWARESADLFRYSEFTQTLARAAAYGLALPEYALHNPHEDISLGVARYRGYQQLLTDKAALEKSIENSFDNWLKVGRQQPPDSLFKAEEAQWKILQQREEELRQVAESIAGARVPPLHLLWDPQSFIPAPEQRLVRSNFPLREVSIPAERARLSHLSFTDLRRTLGRQTAKVFKEDILKSLAKAGKPGFDIKAGNLSDGASMDYWLLSMGARKLEAHDSWFDTEGRFVPAKFKEYLAGQKLIVDSLQSEATFEAWAADLEKILFRKNPLGPLRLFDNSPQARLIRCLTPPPDMLHAGVNVKGFEFSLSNGASVSATAFLDINLARGEVDVHRFELPKRAQAQPVKATYTDYQGQERGVDLGRFCLEGSIKAWGFAGASLLLSTNVALKPSDRKNDVELDTRRDAERGIRRVNIQGLPNVRADEAISASLNLFAGVQAGIKISGSLQWAPPSEMVSARHILSNDSPLSSKQGWLEVATLNGNLSAALGAGAKANFSLSLQNGQVILRLKAALIAGVGADGEFSFVLGYKAIGQFLDILNRELIKNEYHNLEWIESEVFAYFTKMQVLRAVGLKVQWLFLLGYNKVNSLYLSVTAGQRSGEMAYLVNKNMGDVSLRQWFATLTPEGLGALLGTFLRPPKEFEVIEFNGSGRSVVRISENVARLNQQYAIATILRSIVEHAQSEASNGDPAYKYIHSARRNFEEALERFDGLGPKQNGSMNVRRLDEFMKVEVPSDDKKAGPMRAKFRMDRHELAPTEEEYVDIMSYWKW